jgi:Glucose dehydrogenase
MRRRASSCGSSTRLHRPSEPGGSTWGNLPDKNRAGGESWITGSYDPALNLFYIGVAQSKPWMIATRATDGDALYSSSTVALNADTGKLAWYFQHAPAESLDSTLSSNACWWTTADRISS